jgi:hypothetical protein
MVAGSKWRLAMVALMMMASKDVRVLFQLKVTVEPSKDDS